MPRFEKYEMETSVANDERPKVSFLPYFGLLIFAVEIFIIILSSVKLQDENELPSSVDGNHPPGQEKNPVP
jgi:hypothetical protein